METQLSCMRVRGVIPFSIMSKEGTWRCIFLFPVVEATPRGLKDDWRPEFVQRHS